MRTPQHKAEEELEATIQMGQIARTIRDRRTLERHMVKWLFVVTPAERVVVLFSPVIPPGQLMLPAWQRHGSRPENMKVSRTILEQVFEGGLAIIHNKICVDDSADTRTGTRTPISVLAVPVSARRAVAGVLYLETSGQQQAFHERTAEIASLFGVLGGIALENVQEFGCAEAKGRRQAGYAGIIHEFVGSSSKVQEVIEFVGRVAAKDSTVLISGESGTGKELVAQSIHANSLRCHKPFVAINCAALTDTLLESELFGHEKGSFTGAIAQKRGKLEAAEGGTVFLDEVGEMSPVLQAKLLRVLQEREFERVGGTKTHKLNIRLIAATNRDLQEQSQRGGFRQDLFYRLNVVSIEMPPLRDRREDIPLLANHFAAKYGTKLGRPVAGISREARLLLMQYDWPGNVRELENAIERAVVLGVSNMIVPQDLPASVTARKEVRKPAAGLAEGVREAKRQIILQALQETGGNHAKAAARLGVHANHLSRLITTLQLRSQL